MYRTPPPPLKRKESKRIYRTTLHEAKRKQKKTSRFKGAMTRHERNLSSSELYWSIVTAKNNIQKKGINSASLNKNK